MENPFKRLQLIDRSIFPLHFHSVFSVCPSQVLPQVTWKKTTAVLGEEREDVSMSSGRLRERRMRVSRWNVQERNWNYEDTFGTSDGCDGIPCRAILSIDRSRNYLLIVGEKMQQTGIPQLCSKECNFPSAREKACRENNDKSLAKLWPKKILGPNNEIIQCRWEKIELRRKTLFKAFFVLSSSSSILSIPFIGWWWKCEARKYILRAALFLSISVSRNSFSHNKYRNGGKYLPSNDMKILEVPTHRRALLSRAASPCDSHYWLMLECCRFEATMETKVFFLPFAIDIWGFKHLKLLARLTNCESDYTNWHRWN